MVASKALIATSDEIQPHWNALKSRVMLDILRAQMSSQYLSNTDTPDSAHVINENQMRDKHCEMQHVLASIHCGTISVVMTPRLLEKLGLS
jgi:hypothetical protein